MDYFSRGGGSNRGNTSNSNDNSAPSSRPGSRTGVPPATPGTTVPLTPAGTPSRNPAPMRLRRLPTGGNLRAQATTPSSSRFSGVPSQAFATPASRASGVPSQAFATPASRFSGVSSHQDFATPASHFDGAAESSLSNEPTGRRRSSSDPQRPQAAHLSRNDADPALVALPTVVEERPNSVTSPAYALQPFATPPEDPSGATNHLLNASGTAARRSRANSLGERGPSGVARSVVPSNLVERARRGQATSEGRRSRRESTSSSTGSIYAEDQTGRPYEAEVTDFLDVIDPEVATLNTLNNVQNSLFVPYLGRWYSRQPTYTITRPPTRTDLAELPLAAKTQSRLGRGGEGKPIGEDYDEKESEDVEGSEGLNRLHTIKSTLSGMSVGHNYAVLPHGVRLQGWSEEEMDELNDHVRHLLHSRREGFKRSMRAFGKYVQKPMGAFVALYAFIVTFWGTAWFLFLVGWLHAGYRQKYFVEICDQILTALLVVIGIGLFPWRCVDTYHMIFIAHYHYKVWQLRRNRGLPKLQDPNDLPDTDPKISTMLDEEEAADVRHKALRDQLGEDQVVILPLEQQKKLKHHQDKIAKSHTFFKPHESLTHRAFSVKLLITVVVLLDFHSFFQMALGGTTWGIYYRNRPKALTSAILACSICCNISGGIVISIGDHRSRKKEVFEQMFRQERTNEALKQIEKREGKKRFQLNRDESNLDQKQKDMEMRVEGNRYSSNEAALKVAADLK